MAKEDHLLVAVRALLFERWDPIGINDDPVVRDEYDSYAPQICRDLRAGADKHKVASHLRKLQINSMGLEADDDHDRSIAEELIALLEQNS